MRPVAILLAVLILPLAACQPMLVAPVNNPLTGGPIIDMHVHAGPGTAGSDLYPVQPGESDDEAKLRFTVEEMDRQGVVMALLAGPAAHTDRYRGKYPGRFIAGVSFPCTSGLDANLYPCFADGSDFPDLGWLRTEIAAGRIGVLGELYNVYAGVSPDDLRMQPYFDLAAELDIVVAYHADRGPPPPGRVPGCCPHFDGDLGNPVHFAAILKRHPKLRLYLMHMISPDYIEEAIKLMAVYPNVYVEISPMSRVPQARSLAALQRFMEAGTIHRVGFGSDYLGGTGASIEVLEAASFLSAAEKRGIYYENAARFLRLQAGARKR